MPQISNNHNVWSPGIPLLKNGSDYFKLFSKYIFFPDFVLDVDFAIVGQYVDYIKEILEYYI